MPYIDPSFIYVIVDLAKNNLRKTEYKITNHITGMSLLCFLCRNCVCNKFGEMNIPVKY